MEEGNITIFFIQNIELAMAAKTHPHGPQPLRKVKKGEPFP